MTRRALRLVGLALVAAGIGLAAWTLVVWQWQDPFTAVYTSWQQGRLGAQLDRRMREWRPSVPPRIAAAVPRAVAAATPRVAAPPARPAATGAAALRAEAAAYRRSLHEGEPFARLTVPRLGLRRTVVVDGTDRDSLTKGPGRDLRSYLPGEGNLVYVAGHRTTYLAPFSHIDSLRPGDRITLALPYGSFAYAVTGSRVVAADDVSVLRPRNRELLVLQACHPRFLATHRFLVYARLVRFDPRRGLAVEARRTSTHG